MELMVVHTIDGLSWDEWASIVGILAACFTVLGWLIHMIGKHAGNFIKENIHQPVDNVNTNIKGLGQSVDSLRLELHKHAESSSKTLIKMQDRDNDFESRISYLEKIVGKFIKEKL